MGIRSRRFQNNSDEPPPNGVWDELRLASCQDPSAFAELVACHDRVTRAIPRSAMRAPQLFPSTKPPLFAHVPNPKARCWLLGAVSSAEAAPVNLRPNPEVHDPPYDLRSRHCTCPLQCLFCCVTRGLGAYCIQLEFNP